MLWDIYEDIIKLASCVFTLFIDAVLNLLLLLMFLRGTGAILIDVTFKFTVLKAVIALFTVPILIESTNLFFNKLKGMYLNFKAECIKLKEEIEELREEKEDE